MPYALRVDGTAVVGFQGSRPEQPDGTAGPGWVFVSAEQFTAAQAMAHPVWETGQAREQTAEELAAEAAAAAAARKAMLAPYTVPILAAWQALSLPPAPDWEAAVAALETMPDQAAALKASIKLIALRTRLYENGGTWADVLEAAQP